MARLLFAPATAEATRQVRVCPVVEMLIEPVLVRDDPQIATITDLAGGVKLAVVSVAVPLAVVVSVTCAGEEPSIAIATASPYSPSGFR
jgi:hypothetical protein